MKFFSRKKKESEAFLIVGLGNPGREYTNNRHNTGFMVLDKIAEMLETKFSKIQSNALVTRTQHETNRLILVKPRTFMNLSGQAVSALARYYRIPPSQILIIYDDVDLEFENIRIRPEGGSAGQNGMKSIIEKLGTKNFPRIRIGVGRPKGRMRTPDHILQDFSKGEKEILPFILDRAANAVLLFVTNGIDSAMNEYNRKTT